MTIEHRALLANVATVGAIAGSGAAMVGAIIESIPVALAAVGVSVVAVAVKKFEQSYRQRDAAATNGPKAAKAI
jgi:ABC-type uncharacterized transport system substrate-binding protein